LTIFDSKTHFVLWTVTKRVKDARLKDNWEKESDRKHWRPLM
jgi:hypothetical protein